MYGNQKVFWVLFLGFVLSFVGITTDVKAQSLRSFLKNDKSHKAHVQKDKPYKTNHTQKINTEATENEKGTCGMVYNTVGIYSYYLAANRKFDPSRDIGFNDQVDRWAYMSKVDHLIQTGRLPKLNTIITNSFINSKTNIEITWLNLLENFQYVLTHDNLTREIYFLTETVFNNKDIPFIHPRLAILFWGVSDWGKAGDVLKEPKIKIDGLLWWTEAMYRNKGISFFANPILIKLFQRILMHDTKSIKAMAHQHPKWKSWNSIFSSQDDMISIGNAEFFLLIQACFNDKSPLPFVYPPSWLRETHLCKEFPKFCKNLYDPSL